MRRVPPGDRGRRPRGPPQPGAPDPAAADCVGPLRAPVPRRRQASAPGVLGVARGRGSSALAGGRALEDLEHAHGILRIDGHRPIPAERKADLLVEARPGPVLRSDGLARIAAHESPPPRLRLGAPIVLAGGPKPRTQRVLLAVELVDDEGGSAAQDSQPWAARTGDRRGPVMAADP